MTAVTSVPKTFSRMMNLLAGAEVRDPPVPLRSLKSEILRRFAPQNDTIRDLSRDLVNGVADFGHCGLGLLARFLGGVTRGLARRRGGAARLLTTLFHGVSRGLGSARDLRAGGGRALLHRVTRLLGARRRRVRRIFRLLTGFLAGVGRLLQTLRDPVTRRLPGMLDAFAGLGGVFLHVLPGLPGASRREITDSPAQHQSTHENGQKSCSHGLPH